MKNLKDVMTHAKEDDNFRKALFLNPRLTIKKAGVELKKEELDDLDKIGALSLSIEQLFPKFWPEHPGDGVTYPPPIEVETPAAGGIHIVHGGGVLYFGPEEYELSGFAQTMVHESLELLNRKIETLKMIEHGLARK